MEKINKTRTGTILQIMYVIAWVTFIGLLIKTGAVLVSYGVSLINPEASGNLYSGLNLSGLREYSFWYYSLSASFVVALATMKALIVYQVIKALSKVNLVNPFSPEVAHRLEAISYTLFGVWLVSILYNAQSEWLFKRAGIMQGEWSNEGYFFMAGLVFIISQIFKRGLEIQTENELTV